jgi:hypothetical protein
MIARPLTSPFPMVPLRDLPGYRKEGWARAGSVIVLCRGAGRASDRRKRKAASILSRRALHRLNVRLGGRCWGCAGTTPGLGRNYNGGVRGEA